eukprot:468914_1
MQSAHLRLTKLLSHFDGLNDEKVDINGIKINSAANKLQQQTDSLKSSGSFLPGLTISKFFSPKKEVKTVKQLGEITLKTLNKYDCNNPERRLLSLFGTVFDVSSADKFYGPNGDYKMLTGHDVTLCMGCGSMDNKWVDKLVLMKENHIADARQWHDFYESKYPKAGVLIEWKQDQRKWSKLTVKEEKELESGACLVM